MTDSYPPLKYHKPTLFLLALSLSYLFQSYARHNNLVVKEEAVDSDSPIPSDKGTMEEGHMKQHKSIDRFSWKQTIRPTTKMMPILDLKVWVQEIDGLQRIVLEFYAGNVLSQTVLFARSALSWKQRTVQTQELFMFLLNCSAYVPWE